MIPFNPVLNPLDTDRCLRIASAGASCDVKFDFECTDDAGALLFLGSPARVREIVSEQHVRDYMEANSERWLEFANSRLGLRLKEEQILFVTGTTKARSWGVAAFRNKTRSLQGTIRGYVGPMAAAGFSVNISDAQQSTMHHRAGPSERAALVKPAILPGSSDEYDQCVFIRYRKQKRKRWSPFALKAGAGPHQLPDNPDTPGEAACTIPVDIGIQDINEEA